MKKIMHTLFFWMAAAAIITSCETTVHPELGDEEDVLAVDAWINNKRGKQTIVLTTTQSYFNNTLPAGVSGATVTIENLSAGRLYSFTEVAGGNGTYVWTPPSPAQVIGRSGDEFTMTILTNGQTYYSYSTMGRVPAIDSLTFTYEEANSFLPEYFNAEFWATDPEGAGDTYWIRATKNDTLLNKPSEIAVAFDAGFSNGGNFDGVQFIPPIRSSINPFDQRDDGTFRPPYSLGDVLSVEIYSISLAAYNYLTQVSIQTNRPGGFSELFSSPIANVSTNIQNTNPDGKKAVGFFNVAAVSGRSKKVELK